MGAFNKYEMWYYNKNGMHSSFIKKVLMKMYLIKYIQHQATQCVKACIEHFV